MSVTIGGEVVDVAAAFEPFRARTWAVVATDNSPATWPTFLDEATRLGWELHHAQERDGWTWLLFRRAPAGPHVLPREETKAQIRAVVDEFTGPGGSRPKEE